MKNIMYCMLTIWLIPFAILAEDTYTVKSVEFVGDSGFLNRRTVQRKSTSASAASKPKKALRTRSNP